MIECATKFVGAARERSLRPTAEPAPFRREGSHGQGVPILGDGGEPNDNNEFTEWLKFGQPD
jgi:hypothetical protein